MSIIAWIVYQLLGVFDLMLLVYVVASWLPGLQGNQWMQLLRQIVEPVLNPFRRLLARYLPRQWQMLDFSPIAAWLALSLLRNVLIFLMR